MRIINYNPTKVEKEFEELKAQTTQYNKRAATLFKIRATWVASFVVLLLIASIASIVTLVIKNEPHVLLIMLAVVLTVSMVGFLLYLISWLVDGQDKISISHNMSFAMQFWNLYHQGVVLEIDLDPNIVHGIVLTYENEHHFIRTETLIVKEIVFSTEVTELTLDVENGYLIKPYSPKKKPVVEIVETENK